MPTRSFLAFFHQTSSKLYKGDNKSHFCQTNQKAIAMESASVKIALLFVLHVVLTKAASITKADRSRDSVQIMSRPYYIAHACERTMLTLECGNKQKIHLAHATYGRLNLNHCYDESLHEDMSRYWSIHCTAPVRRTTRVVAELCNGRQKCDIPVINILFSDPCPTTYKYLEIYYTCVVS